MHVTTRMWLLMAFVLQPAGAAPVFRCTGPDGIPTYTDQICPGRGEAVEASALRPNVYTPEPLPERVIDDPPRMAADEPPAGCDNADDLRHIDLMLKSLTTDGQQRRFLQAERKRVASCQLYALSPVDREQRDIALSRTRSLRADTREAAEQKIEALYGAAKSGKTRKR